MKKANRKNETFIKGIMTGVLFSTEIFDEYFEQRFRDRINQYRSSVKGGLQWKMLEMFFKDKKKMIEIYNWTNTNYPNTMKENHVMFIKHIILQMLIKGDSDTNLN